MGEEEGERERETDALLLSFESQYWLLPSAYIAIRRTGYEHGLQTVFSNPCNSITNRFRDSKLKGWLGVLT